MNDVHKKFMPDTPGKRTEEVNQVAKISSQSEPYIHFESFGQIFEEIFHESEKGILLIGADGDLLKVNQSGKKLLDLKEEFIGTEKSNFRNWIADRFEISVGFAEVDFSEVTRAECVW